MSPNQIVALGSELLPWARDHTGDLNEAHYLVHQVVARLMSDSGSENKPIGIHEARTLMATVAGAT